MDASVIRTTAIVKSYGDLPVLRNLDLEVRQGEIYGFLGPNGSGKSTTIMVLLGVEKPDAGTCELFGQPVDRGGRDLRRRVGLVPEHQYLYQEMTAWEYLALFARLHQVCEAWQTIERWLEVAGLAERRGVRIANLSNGQRQKLSIVRALIHDPELLILDEPVQGLDPMSVRDLRNLIRIINQEGKTIVLSSHVLSEVEKTAHRVGILHGGRILVEDSTDRLSKRLGPGLEFRIEIAGLSSQIVDTLSAQPFIDSIRQQGSVLIIRVSGPDDHRLSISRIITEHGGHVIGWQQTAFSLEDAFFALTEAGSSPDELRANP